VFGGVEAPALAQLPPAPFVLATWAKAKIGPDLHARVDKVLYSIPWRHIGKTADVRVTATMVQFFIGGELLKAHPRKSWGKQTDFGDYPPVMWNLRSCQTFPDVASGNSASSSVHAGWTLPSRAEGMTDTY
jgi:hypothetical protein